MPIRVNQLEQRLQGGLAPAYLIAGEEPLLVQTACDSVRTAAQQAGFTEREVLTAERGFDWAELGTACAEQSLFAQRKILDLKIPTGKPGVAGAKHLNEWLESPDPDVLLLVSCNQWDSSSRRAKWVKTFERQAAYVEIWPVAPRELPGWIQQRMQAVGLTPSREAVLALAGRVEGNLLAANQEIQKLQLLKGSGEVGVEDIDEVVADSARFDVFRMIELVEHGDLAGGLRIVQTLRITETPMPPVVGAWLREVNLLLSALQLQQQQIPQAKIFQQLNVWRSRQSGVQRALQRLSVPPLHSALVLLARMDQQSKGQLAGDFWQSLEQLVLLLCRPETVDEL